MLFRFDSLQALKKSIVLQKSESKPLTETKKQAARERLNALKEQIKSLKKMQAGMEPEAAKAILAQIKMMPQELRSLAGQLSSGGGVAGLGSSSSTSMRIIGDDIRAVVEDVDQILSDGV